MSSRRKAGRARGKTPVAGKDPAAARVRATKASAGGAGARKRVAASNARAPASDRRASAANGATSASATFPADFTIAHTADVKKKLARVFAQPAAVTLDLSAIRRIDTAGLQVLTAFIRDRRAAGRPVACSGASESFTVTAQMLGLGAVFA
jgi:phospholipid transport system transporter-binding protein